jgi:hypothetical protein
MTMGMTDIPNRVFVTTLDFVGILLTNATVATGSVITIDFTNGLCAQNMNHLTEHAV